MPQLLNRITKEKGQILLAENPGFYQAGYDFPYEAEEELSELAVIHQRRSGLLMNNPGIVGYAWPIVDTLDCSQIGFWPIFLDDIRFVVAVVGILYFNHPDFVTLIWVLSTRHAKNSKGYFDYAR